MAADGPAALQTAQNGLVPLRRVSGRANDTIDFCARQRSERVPDGSGHCLTSLLEPYRKRGAGPRSSSPGDGHRPVLQKGQGGLSLLWRVSRRAAGSVETGWCRCAGFQGGQTTPSISARNSGRKGCPTAAATV